MCLGQSEPRREGQGLGGREWRGGRTNLWPCLGGYGKGWEFIPYEWAVSWEILTVVTGCVGEFQTHSGTHVEGIVNRVGDVFHGPQERCWGQALQRGLNKGEKWSEALE